jgi:hypothetical protein
MKENLFLNLEQLLAPEQRELSSGTFEAYRRSRPARRTAGRHAIYLSRVGALTADQERVVTATAEYVALFFGLPVRPGADFDPASFPPDAIRKHPRRGHPQLLTDHLINQVLWLDRPDDALICLAVTAWDLWSNDQHEDQWGSVFGEALSGHAGVWSLRYLGNPATSDRAARRCLKGSFAVATHEALHVLGLDHCQGLPCTMQGSGCLSGSLHLCPPCLRKLCWNRQLDLLPHLQSLREFLGRSGFSESAEQYESMLALLDHGDASASRSLPSP